MLNQLKRRVFTTIMAPAGLALAATVAFDAAAAPTLWAYLEDDGTQSGRWQECGGRFVEAEAQGFDNDGNIVCFAHDYDADGQYEPGTQDCSGATKHRAALRASSLTFCAGPQVNWTSTCFCDYSLRFYRGEDGVCTPVSGVFRAYSRGEN